MILQRIAIKSIYYGGYFNNCRKIPKVLLCTFYPISNFSPSFDARRLRLKMTWNGRHWNPFLL